MLENSLSFSLFMHYIQLIDLEGMYVVLSAMMACLKMKKLGVGISLR